MLIDFHTHIFPEKIAQSTISALEKNCNDKAFTDGTVEGLLKNMENGNCDVAVTLPVMTKPTQFDSITNFAISVNERFKNENRRLISFGGIHPKCDNLRDKMKYLKSQGFLGVKIHPDYQQTFFDDEGYVEIINLAKEFDMVVVTHAGVDNGYLNQPVKCPPELAKKVIKKTDYNKLVLAHYGGHKQWDEVLIELCDYDVYFDTAFTFYGINESLFKKILSRHGSSRVLFATDCPWSDIKSDFDKLKGYNLSIEDFENITYKNALKLLNIKEKI